MSIIFNQQAEILRPTLIDSPYSTEPIIDWDNPIYQPLDFQVSVQPAGSTEGPVERPQVVTSWKLFTPPATDIPDLTAGSKLRIGGTLTVSIVGHPARWPDPNRPGVVHHLEANLEVVDG